MTTQGQFEDAIDEAVASADWPRVQVLADEWLTADPHEPQAQLYRNLAQRQLAKTAATERRLLTAVFIDLVDSTTISSSHGWV